MFFFLFEQNCNCSPYCIRTECSNTVLGVFEVYWRTRQILENLQEAQPRLAKGCNVNSSHFYPIKRFTSFFKHNIEKLSGYLRISNDRYSGRRPNHARSPAAAGELYILQSSWPFSSSFFILFPYIDIFFITSADSVGTHKRIA